MSRDVLEMDLAVERITLTDAIARKLASLVANGSFSPGEKLPSEKELAMHFDVSRSTLREALGRLISRGLLRVHQGDGYYVREEFSPSTIITPEMLTFPSSDYRRLSELLEARRCIEVELAGLAAQRADADDIQNLADDVDGMEQALSTGAPVLGSDLGFHRDLARAAHNEVLLQMSSCIAAFILEMRKQIGRWPFDYWVTLEEHREIYEAVRAGDSERARQATRIHLEHVAGKFEQLHDSGRLDTLVPSYRPAVGTQERD